MRTIREELRARLAAGADPSSPVRERQQGETEAAVLVPLYLRDDELHAVFTKRREDLRRHPGEISFPGGRRDHPSEQLDATALREAEEEIGLSPEEVELLGTLVPVSTFVTGYLIYPHVGLIEPIAWRPSPNEVELVLELPLHQLVAGYALRPMTRRGFTFETDTYVVGDHLIWGATARILGDLLERLGPLAERRSGPEA
ncbi:MAG TPA: CoA pyrophosphatase [Conexibacter sp.]|nr:CoA pyrophosphatase [Conexibacter sp.]